ncbi:MAG: coagulation factor 5/8 type domain-containing protein [Bacteroidota bacterium]
MITLLVLACNLCRGNNPEESGFRANLIPEMHQPEPGSYHQPDLGKQVFVFDPGMNMEQIQAIIDTIADKQTSGDSEFSRKRYALLFKPGEYSLDIRVGYYTQVMGLGEFPGDVVIRGTVRSNSRRKGGGHVLTNFWRSVENLTIIPSVNSTNTWGVSQAAPMRRVHVKGNLQLHDNGYASGGFMADSKIDGTVDFGPQQQWFSRNSEWGDCSGGAWNIFSLGVTNAPDTNWPDGPYTSISSNPVSREKPYLVIVNDQLLLRIPATRISSAGPSWINGSGERHTLKIRDFYIADPEKDGSESMNAALERGKDLLITPGIYRLDSSLKILRPGTVIAGLGMPSLVPVNGSPAIEVSDIDAVTLVGLLLDAGPVHSETLLRIGEPGSDIPHTTYPVWLYDIFCRVGGPAEGSVTSCVEVNSNDVFIDHIWLWRADHGNGVGWNQNTSDHGIVVNGDRVTVYGLFNEHHQGYQTIWNGNGGRVYLYQSEMPYDPPSVEAWKHGCTGGFASYKVSGQVQTHEAWGVGVYCVFYDAPIVVDNAIETPAALESSIRHKFTFWLNGNENSIIMNIINRKGESVHQSNRKAVLK